MAITVATGGLTTDSINTGAHTVSCTVNGSYNNNVDNDPIYRRFSIFNGSSFQTSRTGGGTAFSSSFSAAGVVYPADTNSMQYTALAGGSQGNDFNGSTVTFKSDPVLATSSAPVISGITATAATVNCNYFPNVNVSSASAQLQYKEASSGSWIDAGSANTTGGYAQVAMTPVNLAGLTSNTLYDTRLLITRTTNNGTSLASTTTQFTTDVSVLVSTDGQTTNSIDQGAHTVSEHLNGSFSNNIGGVSYYYRFRVSDNAVGSAFTAPQGPTTTTTQSWTADVTWPADTTACTYEALAQLSAPPETQIFGSLVSFKSKAVTASATSPSVTAITTTTCSITIPFFGNTNESNYSAQAQYKANSSGVWIDLGSPIVSTGYTTNQYGPTTLTGLVPSTLYNVRMVITRATENETSYTSATTNFTTEAAAVALTGYTGDAEQSVGVTSAIIQVANNVAQFRWDNSDIGSGTIYYRMKYSTNSGLAGPSFTASVNQPVTGYGLGNVFTSNITISGLTGSTVYYYKLQTSSDDSTWTDGTGVIGTFTTALAPTPPTAAFTVSSTTETAGTAIHVVHFINQSTNTPSQWHWNFGDGGSTATDSNPIKSYVAVGTYTVALTVTNADGSDSEIKSNFITVNNGEPLAAFSANTTIGDRPLLVNFVDNTLFVPVAWTWTLPTGLAVKTLYNQNPSVVYPLAGTYPVTLTAANYLGTDSQVSTNFITVRPISVDATFEAGPLTGAPPLSVQFVGSPSGDSTGVAWDFGDATQTTETAPQHVYYTPGTYSVTYTVYGDTAGGGAATSVSSAVRSSYITVAADNTYKTMLEELRRQLLMNIDYATVCTDFVEWGGVNNILRYIYNRICRIQLEAGPMRKTSTTINSLAPGVLALPEDLIEIRSIYVNGVRLEKCDARMADVAQHNWQSAPSGDYQGWYTNPGDHLTLNFVPAITPSTFEVYYVYAPAEPTVPETCEGTWDLLPLPYVFWWIVKYGVLADMLNHEGEMYDIERATLCEQMFAEGVELIKLSLGEQNV